MSLIICPKHGESGFCMRFSKSIIDAIESDYPLTNNDVTLFNIKLLDDEDGEELYTESYLLLKSEFYKMNVPNLVSVDKEEQYDAYKEIMPELGGICYQCFSEYKNRHNTNLLNFN